MNVSNEEFQASVWNIVTNSQTWVECQAPHCDTIIFSDDFYVGRRRGKILRNPFEDLLIVCEKCRQKYNRDPIYPDNNCCAIL